MASSSKKIELIVFVGILAVICVGLICLVESKPTADGDKQGKISETNYEGESEKTSKGEDEERSSKETRHESLRFFAVTDLDKKATVTDRKGRNVWEAFLIQGDLLLDVDPHDPEKSTAKIVWYPEYYRTIQSYYSYGGRGMELSTLNVFNNELVSCDDKSGIIYKLPIVESSNKIRPIPWVILADGDGVKVGSNGFKCEWGTLKDGNLWIGGHGNYYTGKFVKIISPNGTILEHRDWNNVYDKLAKALNVSSTGYVTNEAATWSDKLNAWIFMPRKISKLLPYDGEADETRASNTVLIADEDFKNIEVTQLGPFDSTHGVSEIKFIPGTYDFDFIAVKEIEIGDDFAESFVYVGDLQNRTLMAETSFDDKKYEGLEFFKR